MRSTKKNEADKRPWYIYNVKFVWGIQRNVFTEVCTPTHPAPILACGIYYTEVNILNYHDDREAYIHKDYVQLVKENKAIGFEPEQQKANSILRKPFILKPNSATGDDSCGLAEILRVRNLLNIGFLKIVSDIPLSVTAVYTLSDLENRPVNISVNQIFESRLEYLEDVSGKK